jgi:hypothetical protein
VRGVIRSNRLHLDYFRNQVEFYPIHHWSRLDSELVFCGSVVLLRRQLVSHDHWEPKGSQTARRCRRTVLLVAKEVHNGLESQQASWLTGCATGLRAVAFAN